jgi:hypothetical protein
VQLNVGDLQISKAVWTRKRIPSEIQNDFKFLNILAKGKIVPRYETQFPAIAQVFKELTSSNTIDTFELFNDTTYQEYHLLFNTLLNGYKESVDQIADKAKNGESFGDDLNSAAQTGHALLTMVKGRAFYLFLSTAKFKLSSEERDVQEESNADAEERERDRNVTTLWDPLREPNTATTALWKPFKAWIMLMLVQLDAADALCAFAKQQELSNAELDVKIVYSSLVSDETIPLENLLAELYIPGTPDDPKNEKLYHFVMTAKALGGQLKRVQPFVQGGAEEWTLHRINRAKVCVENILGQYKKEQEYMKEQTKSGSGGSEDDLKSDIIPVLDLCKAIKKLIDERQPSSELPSRFSDLLNLLTTRQDKYRLPFHEKAAFKGALHCEACLASILDKTTRDNIQARIEALKQTNSLDEKLYRSLEQLLAETKVGVFLVHLMINPCSNACRHHRISRESLEYRNVAAQSAVVFFLFYH